MAIARTATGLEGSLLIHPDGTLVTSTTMLATFGEMRMFLVPPEDEKWVKLDGKEVDTQKYPKLAGKIKTLPKMEHMWVYAG